MTPDLFDAYDLAGLHLPNRVVIAPMLRTRSSNTGVRELLGTDCCVQRASAGLIVGERTAVSAECGGILRAPGIFSPEQVEGWWGRVGMQ